MTLNKKGVSGVIVTVLMVLVVISAVGIVSVVIMNFVKDNLSDENLANPADCAALELKISGLIAEVITTSSPDVDPVITPGTISINRAGGDKELTGIKVFINGEQTEVITTDLPKVGETKTLELNVSLSQLDTGNEVYIAGVLGATQCETTETSIVA